MIGVGVAVLVSVEGLVQGTQLAPAVAHEAGPSDTPAVDLVARLLRTESALACQVKQKGLTVTVVLPWDAWWRGPLSSGESSNAVSLLNLKQAYGGSLIRASRVEVFEFPAIVRPPVKQSRHEFPAAEDLVQVLLLFILRDAL